MQGDPQFELLKGVGDRKQKVLDLWDRVDSTLSREDRLREFARVAEIQAKSHGIMREGDIALALRTAAQNARDLSSNIVLMEEACSRDDS